MINWQRINTVFFDMDGTLLDLHFDNYFWLKVVPEQFATKNNLNLTDAKHHVRSLISAKIGNLEWYCIDYWSKQLELDILQLKINTQTKIDLRPQAKQLLQYLQNLNKQMVLVTNAHPDTLELKMCVVKLQGFFSNMITSHQLGLAKEESGFWDKLQQIEPFDVNHTLFIDDSNSVLQAAKKYGFKHLLGISRPDLKADKITYQDFKAIDNFADIML